MKKRTSYFIKKENADFVDSVAKNERRKKGETMDIIIEFYKKHKQQVS